MVLSHCPLKQIGNLSTEVGGWAWDQSHIPHRNHQAFHLGTILGRKTDQEQVTLPKEHSCCQQGSAPDLRRSSPGCGRRLGSCGAGMLHPMQERDACQRKEDAPFRGESLYRHIPHDVSQLASQPRQVHFNSKMLPFRAELIPGDFFIKLSVARLLTQGSSAAIMLAR